MKRPHIIVNVAMTVDGKIDSYTRKGAEISSSTDKARVDQLRASVDAVLVGGRTLLHEDPKLTVKSAKLRSERISKGLPENPAKVGIISEIPGFSRSGFQRDGHGNRQYSHVPFKEFINSGPAQVFLFTTRCNDPEVLGYLETAGVTVRTLGQDRVDLVASMQALYEKGIRSVLVEGGGTLIAELFRLDLVDEISVHISPRIFGGLSSPTLADSDGFLPNQAIRLNLESVEKLDAEGGLLVHYSVKHKEK